jgi:hypothetical protein
MFSYDMPVETRHSHAQATAAVERLVGVAPVGAGRFEVGALEITVAEIDHPIIQEISDKLLGRRATLRVLFDLDNKAEPAAYHEADKLMLLTAARLAVDLDAEACLSFQGEQVEMRRRSGELLIYMATGTWHYPEVLAALPQPWTATDAIEHG